MSTDQKDKKIIENVWLNSMKGLNSELKNLDIDIRNKVRAAISSDGKNALRLINNLREKNNSYEVVKIEKVLRIKDCNGVSSIPQIFPEMPQTSESFVRLSVLPLEKYLKIFDILCFENKEKLTLFLECLHRLNYSIISSKTVDCDLYIKKIIDLVGYSHFLLRKAALVKARNNQNYETPNIDKFLSDSGLGNNNTIVSSVIQSYQEEQDYLVMKRSIMNIRERGDANKFTRDMTRLIFHPHAKNYKDLCEMLQSNLQSSFIDALILLKINSAAKDFSSYKGLSLVVDGLGKSSGCINDLAKKYIDSGGETLFYKHTSAWLENKDVINYRLLQDHFNDDPAAEYLNIDQKLIDKLGNWVESVSLSKIGSNYILTKHKFPDLHELEYKGNTTRSAVYNYIIFLSEGYDKIPENELINLMGKTRDLHKTINTEHHKNLVLNSETLLSRIIFYLLIAKKSRNEADNFSLRRHLQEIVKRDHEGSLLAFVKFIESKSHEVAIYLYETCTEDFIAKLSHLIFTPYAITETRASLHQWMSELTGEKAYLDRARALLIDHQINRIRNEIDDNRIYVDSARFAEWINDEVTRDLDVIFSSIEYNKKLEEMYDPQLFHLVAKCYAAFCGNNFFGIASYLGRRIRHGTFKGHLYSSVIAIEDKYPTLLRDASFFEKWRRWKANYESCVDMMIQEYLHVESISKPNGLLKPNIKERSKIDTVLACSRKLIEEYSSSKTSNSASQIITEYCWRLLEHDLRNIKSFIKGKKSDLVQSDLLSDFKNTSNPQLQNSAKDFARDVQRHANDKLLTMYNWFNRPASVSPKASVYLLYKAVVAEVRDTFPNLEADTEFDAEKDIVLAGGAYHVLYDAFYVIVFNAAKHGKTDAGIKREIFFRKGLERDKIFIVVSISSEIRCYQTEEEVSALLKVSPEENIEDAHLFEGRSGLRKLHHLQKSDNNFSIDKVCCQDRKVTVEFAYKLEHT
ncbi:hypothetical protein [Halomonas sp. DWK9]|uniref:hypothetical protein n=1 Tax=Halomonas sp. DWK9 TaxID=3060155 RepID=UPI00287FC7BC|nr:hypothetical protein [Halomonas sp. DWK9]